jgi:hypothetical protein
VDSLEEAKSKIAAQVLLDQTDVRNAFHARFLGDAHQFSSHAAESVVAWQRFDHGTSKHVGRAWVSAILHGAISSQIVSMKLLLEGHLVASGMMMRQALEFSALSVLTASPKLSVLPRYMQGKYSATNAIRDLRSNCKKLGLPAAPSEQFKRAEQFFSVMSHATPAVLATHIGADAPLVYQGAHFDEGHLWAYEHEVASRCSFASIFPGIVALVASSVQSWPDDWPPASEVKRLAEFSGSAQ